MFHLGIWTPFMDINDVPSFTVHFPAPHSSAHLCGGERKACWSLIDRLPSIKVAARVADIAGKHPTDQVFHA
jgi:hypothetical protein